MFELNITQSLVTLCAPSMTCQVHRPHPVLPAKDLRNSCLRLLLGFVWKQGIQKDTKSIKKQTYPLKKPLISTIFSYWQWSSMVLSEDRCLSKWGNPQVTIGFIRCFNANSRSSMTTGWENLGPCSMTNRTSPRPLGQLGTEPFVPSELLASYWSDS